MSSNDLTQVRDYINTRMAIVEPGLNEWKGSIANIGNIPQTLLDTSYHITLGVDSSTPDDTVLEDGWTVIITIFRRAYNEPVEARDALMQVGNCIRLDLVSKTNVAAYKVANDGNIEDVESVSLTPSEIDASNDNIIQVEIELNVRLFFGVT